MATVQIIVTVETGDPKGFIAAAAERVPADWPEPAYAIDGEWVDEEGDAL
jgi:hypothetical protein